MLDKQIFRGVLSLLNAKEKRPKLQCLRRFLSLSLVTEITGAVSAGYSRKIKES